jgi:hypothetical protein
MVKPSIREMRRNMLKKIFKKLLGNKETGEVSGVQVMQNANVTNKPIQNSTTKIEPPKLDIFEFNVAGVTAKNEQKQDIQKLLRQQGKLYAEENDIDLYGGYTNKEIIEDGLEVAEFEDLIFYKHEISFVPEPANEYDQNAIKVYIKYGEFPVHIGYVSKKENVEFKNILDNEDVRRIEARYVGGKIKSTDYDVDKGKDIVVTEELTLGVEFKVYYKK